MIEIVIAVSESLVRKGGGDAGKDDDAEQN
jgi:hypothetical protein